MVKAAILILTQNNDVRRAYLKTTLYFLFKNFNSRYRYPVLLLHEADYDAEAQREILMGVRAECRDLVSFVALDPEDFQVPAHIDRGKMARCIETRPVPYWRNEAYRLMCRWWIVEMPKYAAGYDYIMRLDDDSIIEEPIQRDLFAWAAEKELVYAGNIVHTDCAICCYGMRDWFREQFAGDAEALKRLDGIFTEQELPMKSVQMHPFRQLLSILDEDKPTVAEGRLEIGERLKVYSPMMFFNNYHITRTDFWQREDVRRVCEAFDKDGRWAYCRWGDSPVQSVIVMLMAKPEEIQNTKFAYSKRLQREAFVGTTCTGAREVYSYMPALYSQSSCVTEAAEK